MNLLKKEIEKILINAIESCGIDLPDGTQILKNSDRPDLSDFQSNIAMSLAKALKKNPRQIATDIVSKIDNKDLTVSIDGPGFINIVVGNNFVSKIVSRETFAPHIQDNPKKIVIDYGGPNVAKSLHVGHLRSSIIGESLKNLARFMGYNVVGDIHLGDWGLPMGLIITSIKEQGLKLPLTVAELNPIYPEASKRSKVDEAFMATAQEETKKLQNGDKENREIWKSFWNTSVNDMKRILSILNVDFDLWLGESDANDDVNMLVQKFQENGFTKMSEGAEVIDLADYPMNGTEVPPFIVVKSNGAVMYGMTDLATLYDRIKRQNADIVWYVVDSRQALHFHQVFSATKITGIKGNCDLEHLGFGSVLGLDGKPLKTRNGDNVTLEELITSTIDMAQKKIDENEKTKSLPEAEKQEIARDVGIAALKFADLVNPRTTDYIFNLEKFTSFEGKTGPYILYTAVRIKSLLRDIKEDFADAEIVLSNKSDKALAMKLCEFDEAVEKSFDVRGVHILVQYIYELATVFNDFYHNCKIGPEENLAQKKSWLKLSQMTLTVFEQFANIIKINIPERM
ncbi:MAG: arginine--tRNA ligase [Alphaproteobacteria bacterium]|nr:arginine--tRNA ligase [Alphaproteobacteria bacterium]